MGEKETERRTSVGLGQASEVVTREAQQGDEEAKVVEKATGGVKQTMQTQV